MGHILDAFDAKQRAFELACAAGRDTIALEAGRDALAVVAVEELRAELGGAMRAIRDALGHLEAEQGEGAPRLAALDALRAALEGDK